MAVKKKFNLDDNEVQQWKAFEHSSGNVYSLEHLDAELVTYQDDKNPNITYKFYVTYSHHCFAKSDDELSEEDNQINMYPSPKDRRPFNLRRYILSFHLPDIVKSLPDLFVFHGGYDSYCSVTMKDENGQQITYQIAFSVFRSKKKLRLHVESAYPLDEDLGRKRKVGFLKIARALLSNKRLPKPSE